MKMILKRISLLILFTISFGAFKVNAQTFFSYKTQNRFSLPGDGGWDYLTSDDTTNRLFISHKSMVQVMNQLDGKIIATIPDLNGVHGIALANEFNKGFISTGKDSGVTIFDLTTYKVIEKIRATGSGPDAIMYDPFSKKIFVFNGHSSNATVIDALTNKIITTIDLDGTPEFAVSDEAGKIYVNIEDKSEISVINSINYKVMRTWSIKPGKEPSGLAIDNVTHRLFSVCDSMMIVVDAIMGNVVATLPIGDKVDGVVFDPHTKRIFSSNGDGSITVVQEVNDSTYKVLTSIETQKGARTIAINKKTQHLYLPVAFYGATPPKTAEKPHPRPDIIPGTFVILDIQ